MFIFEIISGLGSTVMMPIIITVFGLILGIGFGKSFRAGLTVGVGLIGLNAVIGLMGGALAPAAAQLSANFGLQLDIIDVGWPAAAAIAFAGKVGTLIIPVGIAVNMVMIATKSTQTINIDIWNFWHYAFTGGLVASLTDNLMLGFVAAIANIVIVMVIADVTAPLFEEYNGLTGVSIPMAFSAAYAPIAWVVNEVIERIPGLNKLDFNLDDFQKKLGGASLLFEPIVLGTIIGFLVALFAGYPIDPRVGGTTVFSIAMTMGAALVLIPKMASLLMEGLIPIAQASQEFVQKRYEGKGNFYIGLDSAVALGHPLTLALGIIITPLTLLIAVGLSKIGLNGVLPAVDLVVLPFIFIFVVPICKGNGFRALLTGILLIVAGLMISTALAPVFTDVAIMADAASYEGVGLISSICDGANPLTYVLVMPFKWIGEMGAVVVLSVVSLIAAIWNRRRIANL